jgi:hypothetical protein
MTSQLLFAGRGSRTEAKSFSTVVGKEQEDEDQGRGEEGNTMWRSAFFLEATEGFVLCIHCSRERSQPRPQQAGVLFVELRPVGYLEKGGFPQIRFRAQGTLLTTLISGKMAAIFGTF